MKDTDADGAAQHQTEDHPQLAGGLVPAHAQDDKIRGEVAAIDGAKEHADHSSEEGDQDLQENAFDRVHQMVRLSPHYNEKVDRGQRGQFRMRKSKTTSGPEAQARSKNGRAKFWLAKDHPNRSDLSVPTYPPTPGSLCSTMGGLRKYSIHLERLGIG